MTVSAHDIAAEFRRRLPGVGKKKLHKLLYYAHGHHLADLGTPLFSENVRAWRMGPVVGSLWQEEDRGEPAPEPHELSEAELNSIGYTISRYGNLTGNDLERFSHTEEPWIVSRRSYAEGGSDRINNDLIRDFFRRIDDDDDEAGAPREVIRDWLSATRPSANPPLGTPTSREALVARLSVA